MCLAREPRPADSNLRGDKDCRDRHSYISWAYSEFTGGGRFPTGSETTQGLTVRIAIGVVARASMNWGSVAASPSARNAAVRRRSNACAVENAPHDYASGVTHAIRPTHSAEPLCISIVECDERVPGRARFHEFA